MPPNQITEKHRSRCKENLKPLLYYMYLLPFNHVMYCLSLGVLFHLVSCNKALPLDFLAHQHASFFSIAGSTSMREDGQFIFRAWLFQPASRVEATEECSQRTCGICMSIRVVGVCSHSRCSRSSRTSRSRTTLQVSMPHPGPACMDTYLSVAIQEDFLRNGILLLLVETPRWEDSRLSTNSTGNNLPNPAFTNHSLYIPLASLPMPKKKNIKKPQARLIHRS